VPITKWLLERAGMRVEKCEEIPHYDFLRNWLFSAWRLDGREQLAVVAVKK